MWNRTGEGRCLRVCSNTFTLISTFRFRLQAQPHNLTALCAATTFTGSSLRLSGCCHLHPNSCLISFSDPNLSYCKIRPSASLQDYTQTCIINWIKQCYFAWVVCSRVLRVTRVGCVLLFFASLLAVFLAFSMRILYIWYLTSHNIVMQCWRIDTLQPPRARALQPCIFTPACLFKRCDAVKAHTADKESQCVLL